MVKIRGELINSLSLAYLTNISPREAETIDKSIPPIGPTSITVTNPKKGGAAERGTRPKLLTSLHGVGLAVLRSTQLGEMERNELSMHVESSGIRYHVRHWVPSWWPEQNISDDVG
jgi:hypothetical protein